MSNNVIQFPGTTTETDDDQPVVIHVVLPDPPPPAKLPWFIQFLIGAALTSVILGALL